MSVFAIYSPSYTEKLFLEQEQFTFIDDHFDCSIRNSNKLLNFIDTVFYEVHSLKKYPILEKLKMFIKNLITLQISLPLLKQILKDFQKLDASLQLYQKHIKSFDYFFTEHQIQISDKTNNGITSLSELNQDEQFPSNYYSAQFLDQNMGSLNMFNFYGQQTPTKRLLQKVTVKELQSTMDSVQRQFDTSTNGSIFTKCSQFQYHEPEDLSSNFLKNQAHLMKGLSPNKKEKEKLKKSDVSSLYIESFKKLKNVICQMIIKDQSIGKLVNAEINKQIQKLKMDQQISERYKMQKNCLYQKHVKSSILNCKLKQRKKTNKQLNNLKN